MRIRSLLIIFLFVVSIAKLAQAQSEQAVHRAAQGKVINQEDLVSFSADVSYTKAIQLLGELSKKIDGKLLIDRSPLQGKDKTIGINIESMYWKDALELILRSNQLWYNDYPEYLEILSLEELGKQAGEQTQKENQFKSVSQTPSFAPAPAVAPVSAVVDSSEYYSKLREVAISSVFFDLNKTKLAQSGMDFSIFRGSNMNLGVNFHGATSATTTGTNGTSSTGGTSTSGGTSTITGTSTTSGTSTTQTGSRLTDEALSAVINPTGNIGVNINAAIAMFESDQLGEVIARPQITVRSGSVQTIQIGQDFSVLEKDFSGNTVQRFYPTGTILTVRPKIYKVGDMEFIDVQYKVEKSTFTTGTTTSIINKTQASGSLTLLNGEEGYIGGMYSNDNEVVREGVPFLKDLPWWVFGLRYLFGYDSKETIKRELIVLIKAEILPSLEERAAKQPATKNFIQEKRQEMEKDLNNKTGIK
jgi:type IV pilus assembly protein PilQ